MSFLDPVAGLIAAGLSVPAVLLLYFLKLRRQPLRVSSTLLWERAVHDVQVNAPFRWLRLSWLLILQLLIALLISGAIGRPALSGAAAVSGRVVIVIDNSASMNALDGIVDNEATLAAGGRLSRLEQAKEDALKLIKRLRRGEGGPGGGGVQISIASWAAQARRLTSFTEDETALREAVAAIAPTDQPQRTADLVRLVEALGAASTDEESAPERTQAFLLSDGGGFAEEDGGAIINAPVDVTYVRIGSTPPPRAAPPSPDPPTAAPTPSNDPAGVAAAAASAAHNLGIVAISARRDHEEPTLARIFVRLLSTDPQPREIPLQLRVDGRLEQVATVRVSTADEESDGEAAHTFDLINTRGGTVAVTLGAAGPGDLLEADDGAAVVLHPPRRPSVLVVAPGENGAGADRFLLSALNIMPLQKVETVDEAGYASMLSAGGIARFELVVFDRVAAAPPPTASIHLGADPGVPGVSMGPFEDDEAPESDGAGEGGVWTRVLMWERTHPIMRNVSLDNLVVAPPLRLTLPQPGDTEEENAAAPPLQSTVLATGSTGPLIALVNHRNNERLLLSFEMSRTNWGPEASWLIFLANAVDVLTMRSEAMTGRAYTTAEPVRLQAAVGAAAITLEGPVELRYSIGEERRSGGGELISLGLLEQAGVYVVTGAARVQELAVNLVDQEESRIDVRPAIRIGGKAMAGRGVGEAAPREIWHWFVLVAVGLLGVEWLLYAWRMRL